MVMEVTLSYIIHTQKTSIFPHKRKFNKKNELSKSAILELLVPLVIEDHRLGLVPYPSY